MFKAIEVKDSERVVLFRDGEPVRALGPGRHLLWGRLTEKRFDTDALRFRAASDVRDVLPESWYSEVSLNSKQRGILVRDGVPLVFLRPGLHRYWTVSEAVKLIVLSINETLPELTEELVAILPRKEYIVATVQTHQRGMEYRQGEFTRVLSPGTHAYWTHPETRVHVELVNAHK